MDRKLTAEEAILNQLDHLRQGMVLPGLVEAIPGYDFEDLKIATKSLYEARRIQRLSAMGNNGKPFFVYFSLYVHTTKPIEVEQEPRWEPLPEPVLTVELRERLIERLEQDVAEPVVEPPKAKPSFKPFDVIESWKLSYPLSRIIDILGSARKRPLTLEDAAQIGLLAKQHAIKQLEK